MPSREEGGSMSEPEGGGGGVAVPGACVTVAGMTMFVLGVLAYKAVPDRAWLVLSALSALFLTVGAAGFGLAWLIERRWGPLSLQSAVRAGVLAWLVAFLGLGVPAMLAWTAWK
jgi:hypothetical protein